MTELDPKRPVAGSEPSDKAMRQFKLWFFRDVPEDVRLKLFGIMMYGIAARELETHGAQNSALKFCLDAIASPIPHPESEGEKPAEEMK